MINREEALDLVGLSVGVDDTDVRVPTGGPVELGKDPEEMRQQYAVHTAVAHDEDGLARAFADEAIDRAKRARQDLIERLATRPRDKTIVVPVRQAARLIERLSGSIAYVDFAQRRQQFDRKPVTLRYHLRGIARTGQIARDDPVELHLGELIGDRGGLLPAACGERRVRLSGEDAGGVALALTVAHEIEGRWLHDSSRCCARSVQPAT